MSAIWALKQRIENNQFWEAVQKTLGGRWGSHTGRWKEASDEEGAVKPAPKVNDGLNPEGQILEREQTTELRELGDFHPLPESQ